MKTNRYILFTLLAVVMLLLVTNLPSTQAKEKIMRPETKITLAPNPEIKEVYEIDNGELKYEVKQVDIFESEKFRFMRKSDPIKWDRENYINTIVSVYVTNVSSQIKYMVGAQYYYQNDITVGIDKKKYTLDELCSGYMSSIKIVSFSFDQFGREPGDWGKSRIAYCAKDLSEKYMLIKMAPEETILYTTTSWYGGRSTHKSPFDHSESPLMFRIINQYCEDENCKSSKVDKKLLVYPLSLYDFAQD